MVWLATLILIILLFFLYNYRYITGKTAIIIILLYIIFVIIFSIGAGFTGLFKSICMNDKCSVVKLPFDITKIRQLDQTNYLYSVVPTSNQINYQ